MLCPITIPAHSEVKNIKTQDTRRMSFQDVFMLNVESQNGVHTTQTKSCILRSPSSQTARPHSRPDARECRGGISVLHTMTRTRAHTPRKAGMPPPTSQIGQSGQAFHLTLARPSHTTLLFALLQKNQGPSSNTPDDDDARRSRPVRAHTQPRAPKLRTDSLLTRT